MGTCQASLSIKTNLISKEQTYKLLSPKKINPSSLSISNCNDDHSLNTKATSIQNVQFNNSKRISSSHNRFKKKSPGKIINLLGYNGSHKYKTSSVLYTKNSNSQKKYTAITNKYYTPRIINQKLPEDKYEKMPLDNKTKRVTKKINKYNKIESILNNKIKSIDNSNISNYDVRSMNFDDDIKSIKNRKIIEDEDDTEKIINNLNEQIKKKNNKTNNSLILSFDDFENKNKNEDIQLYYLNEFNFNPDNIFSTGKDFDKIIQSQDYKKKIDFTNLLLLLPERRWYKEIIELSDSLKINRKKHATDPLYLNEYLNKFIKIYNHFNHLVWALGYFYSNSLLFNKSKWFKQEKINLPSHYSLEWIKGFEWKGLHIRVLTYEQSKKIRHEIKALEYTLLDYLQIFKDNANDNKLNYNNLLSNEIIFPFMSYTYIGGIILYVSVEIKKIFYEENYLSSNINMKNMKDDIKLEKLKKSLMRQSLRFSIKYDNFDYGSENFDEDISFDENILNNEINLSNFTKDDLNNTKILNKITEKNLLKIFDEFNDKKNERRFKFILINMYSLLPDLFKEDDKTIYHKFNQINCIDIKNEFEIPRFINLTKANNLDKSNEMALLTKLIRINATKENISIYQNTLDNVDYKIIYDNSNRRNKINEQVTKFLVQLPFLQNVELSRLINTEYINVGNLNSILNKYSTNNTEEIPDRNIIIYRTSFRVKTKYSLLNLNKEKAFPSSNEEYISYFKQVCKEMSDNSYKIRNIDNLFDFCERYGINKKFIPFFIEYIEDEYLRNLIQIYLYTYFIKKFYNYHEGQTLFMKLAIFERCKDESIINSSDISKDNNIIEMKKKFIVDIIKLIFLPLESIRQSDPKEPFAKLFFQNISFFIFLKMLKLKNFDKYLNFQSTLAQLEIKNILMTLNEISRKNPFLFIDSLERMIGFRMSPFYKYRASIDINNLKNLTKKDIIIFSPKTKSFIDISSIASYVFSDYANNIPPPKNMKNNDFNELLSKIDLDNFYSHLIFRCPIAYDKNNKLLLNPNHYYVYNENIMKSYYEILEQILKGITSQNGEKELILFKSYLYSLLNSFFCLNNANEAKNIVNKMKGHLKYQNLFSFTQYSILYLLEAIASNQDLPQTEELYTKSLLLSLLSQGDIRSLSCKIHQFLMFPLLNLSKITSRYNNHYLSQYLDELNFILDKKISTQIENDNKNKKLNLGYYSFPFEFCSSDKKVNKDFMNDTNFKSFICNVIIDYFYSIDNLLYDDDILEYFNINIKEKEDNQNCNNKTGTNNDESYNSINRYISEYLLDEMSYQKSAPNNIVISFGNNNYSQTALDYSDNINSPKIIYSLLGINIKKIYSGYDYNFSIDVNDKIYAWGLNSDGQCGIPDKEIIKNPTEIKISELENDEKINNISCGNNFTYFLSNKNKIYLCGYNLLTKEKYFSPKRVKLHFEKEIISQIETGEKLCLFLTKMGNVYIIGEGESSKLGFEGKNLDTNEEHIEPKQVMNIRNIQSISCGYNHCFAISKNNIIFCWGSNDRGQLGINNLNEIQKSQKNIIYIPRKVVLSNEIKNIFCGKDFTVFHTEEKEILVCGNNEECQLGIGKEAYTAYKNDIDCYKPIHVEQFYNLEILKVSCGENFCIAMVRDSISKIVNIWSWGSNKEGQLGLGNKTKNSRPKPIPILLEYINHLPKDISCGKNHCLVLLKRNGELNINNEKIINDMIIKYNKF